MLAQLLQIFRRGVHFIPRKKPIPMLTHLSMTKGSRRLVRMRFMFICITKWKCMAGDRCLFLDKFPPASPTPLTPFIIGKSVAHVKRIRHAEVSIRIPACEVNAPKLAINCYCTPCTCLIKAKDLSCIMTESRPRNR